MQMLKYYTVRYCTMAAIHFTLSEKLAIEFQAAMEMRKRRETEGAPELERGDKRRFMGEAIREWIEEEKMTARREKNET